MRDNVLFVCEGVQHLATTLALAKSLKKSGIESSLFYGKGFIDNSNRRVFKFLLNDKLAVPGILQNVGLVVFLTNESSPYCMVSNKIGFISKRTNTPTLSVQHGWIQPGLNYHSNLSKVGFTERDTDNSPALWHFSPVVNIFGDDGIGYPTGLHKPCFELPPKAEINVLISTNFNWNVYSRESIIGFLRALIALKQNFPFINLMHRPHPAENADKMIAELGVYMDIVGTKKGKWTDIYNAIDWADVLISTPSTAVLDAYFKGVPSFVYKATGFEDALSQVNDIAFKDGNELTSLMSSLLNKGTYCDPGFPAFNPEKFESIIRQYLGRTPQFTMNEEDFIQYVNFCKS